MREHEVYALGNAPAPQRAPRQKAAHAAAFEKLGHTASTARIGVMRRPKLATALAVALILGSAVALRVNLRNGTIPPPPPEEPVAATTLPEPVATPAAPAPAVQPETKAPPAAPVAKAEPPPRTGLFRKTPAQTPTPAPPQPVEVATGTVRLIVLPWGEIHIDGQRYGVAPPLRDIALKPGPHRIEIRNPGFASYVQVVEVESGKEIRIRHRFR